MSLSRRDFLKTTAAASAAAAVGITVPQEAQAAAAQAESGWRWDKAACRFCMGQGRLSLLWYRLWYHACN